MNELVSGLTAELEHIVKMDLNIQGLRVHVRIFSVTELNRADVDLRLFCTKLLDSLTQNDRHLVESIVARKRPRVRNDKGYV